MNFLYRAKDLSGQEHKGEIESSDERSAATLLRRRGLVVISISAKSKGEGFLDKFLNRVSFTDLVLVTRQLATMIGAGLVLSEAMDILEDQQTNKRFKTVLGEVSHDIKGGLTLAAALGKHRDVFPPLYVNLVKSGEASGKLDEVLLKMADSLEKEREFQARVRGAMIYPGLVITMMVGVVIIMMIFVVPKLTDLYSESTLELPLPTRILIGVSNMFVNFWWAILATIAIVIIVLKRWVQTPKGSYAFDRFVLKVPLVGKIVTNVNLTNLTRTFGLLISSGIPLLEAISIVEEVSENGVFKTALRDSYTGVERGLPFSSLLTASIFPRIVSQMVKVGEETGKVDEIFFKLSDYFESESDHLVKNLTVAIEPIVLVVLGIGVAFLVISIILPIYKLTTSF